MQVDQVTHSDCETSVVQQYMMLNRAKIAGAAEILCQNRHRPLQAGHQVVSSSPVPLPSQKVSWLRIKGHLMVGQARQCAFLELLVLAWDMGCASLFLCEQSSWHDQFPRFKVRYWQTSLGKLSQVTPATADRQLGNCCKGQVRQNFLADLHLNCDQS